MLLLLLNRVFIIDPGIKLRISFQNILSVFVKDIVMMHLLCMELVVVFVIIDYLYKRLLMRLIAVIVSMIHSLL
ncbi:hypothetical protein DXA15_22170 [Parabacteroides sp. AM58-2XD]|nr:hypothetical protein DXA15_22170 [Parabacteroides sp. AM58-2XD]